MNSLAVYYRIFTQFGAVLPKSSADIGDPSIGRILGMLVTPPHTVASLKKCLCRTEGVKGQCRVELFLSCTAQSPMDDGQRISLLPTSGPGSLSYESMALVVNDEKMEWSENLPEYASSLSTEIAAEPWYCMRPSPCLYTRVSAQGRLASAQCTIDATKILAGSLARNRLIPVILFYHGWT